MVTNGLIGYTGFVGQNLCLSTKSFDQLYNTQNIRSIRGKQFNLLVCAAPQAKKWWANQNPEADWSMIQTLIQTLEEVQADRFILLSTIDVFPTIINADESFDCASRENHAYGRHRLQLEQAVTSHFSKSHIVRLPGLFGPGLKKNVIFDLLHHNQVDKINPDSQFQWYDLKDLWPDLNRIMQAELSLIVLATEPISTREIHHRFFPELVIGTEASPTVTYDIHTRYAEVFSSQSDYIRSKAQILERLNQFIATEKNAPHETFNF
ncbi:MAG: NAD-dependent epimerase/dehydratase family protein [Spirulina sp.]